MKRIAVLLNGGIRNDSRVIKTCKSLSKVLEVHLFYINITKKDSKLFIGSNVILHGIDYQLSLKQNILRHSLLHKEFDFFYDYVLKTNIHYNLIYANDFPTLNVAVKLKKNYKAKLIYDSHEIYISTLNQFFDFENLPFHKRIILRISLLIMRGVGKKMEKRLIPKADYMLTVNESLQNHFVEKYSPNQINYLYNAPALKEKITIVSDIRDITNWRKEDIIYLYQGVLNKGRGIELLIDAFALIKNDAAKLLIIGDGILLPLIKRRVEELGLKEKIQFLGFVDVNLLSSYTMQANFTLFFLEAFNLSTSLASPNKIFQYIHAEVPIITNYTVENDKVFQKYKIGYQAELDKQAITDIIDYSVKNIDQRDALVAECKRAKLEYNWEKQEEKLLRIIQELL